MLIRNGVNSIPELELMGNSRTAFFNGIDKFGIEVCYKNI